MPVGPAPQMVTAIYITSLEKSSLFAFLLRLQRVRTNHEDQHRNHGNLQVWDGGHRQGDEGDEFEPPVVEEFADTLGCGDDLFAEEHEDGEDDRHAYVTLEPVRTDTGK